MDENIECAKCTKIVCNTRYSDQASSNCPTITKRALIERVVSEYNQPEVKEFAHQACLQHNAAVMMTPEGYPIMRNPRVEEVAQFAKRMRYKKLGIAFCSALRSEATVLTTILENRGFDVVSACCMAGGLPVETVGLTDEEKLGEPGSWQSMCSPITQAELLNDEGTEFNIAVGLCIGHDSLFFKFAKAPTTVLVVKDRVLGHNPVVALYQANVFYRWLMRKEPLDS